MNARPKNELEHPQFFFMWKSGNPYITSICGWSKEEVKRARLRNRQDNLGTRYIEWAGESSNARYVAASVAQC
jgi:hypothetical protein